MRARKGVAGDFFAAFDAFEKEGVPCTLGDAQIGANGSQQIGGKNVVDRDEVTLFRETLEFAEVRLDHESRFTVPTEFSIDRFPFKLKEKPIITLLRAVPVYP